MRQKKIYKPQDCVCLMGSTGIFVNLLIIELLYSIAYCLRGIIKFIMGKRVTKSGAFRVEFKLISISININIPYVILYIFNGQTYFQLRKKKNLSAWYFSRSIRSKNVFQNTLMLDKFN